MSEEHFLGPDRWARLRFSIVGPLLAAPPGHGDLKPELVRLAAKTWRHPVTGEPVRFGLSTIERWLHRARGERIDPVAVLRRKPRGDAGTHPSIHGALAVEIRAQWTTHKSWSYQLHYDNFEVLVAEDAKKGPSARLGRLPSYPTIRRFMKHNGLRKLTRPRGHGTPGGALAEARLAEREVRSYEATQVHGLWHMDFHEGRRKVLTPRGEWVKPRLFCVIDDYSRFVCHAQWYLNETAEVVCHGLSQAIQKTALPAAAMHDNGAGFIAGETQSGFEALSTTAEPTLPYSPYQNAKQECFWGQVEGRLMAMLEGLTELTLDRLNEATLAWITQEYNREKHEEIGVPPLRRYTEGPSVGRTSPGSEQLRRAFKVEETRTQRRSDGTVGVARKRFEVPSRFRHVEKVTIRYARWDLSTLDMIDPRTKVFLAALYPQDKARNGDGHRRRHDEVVQPPAPSTPPTASGMAPLLEKLVNEYRACGLPPAYLPHYGTPEETK